MNALLIIDLQNDFLPGGALPAPEGNKIIPVINGIMNAFKLVLASKDWHPPGTAHFDHWPTHCIRDTEGSEFPEEFNHQPVEQVFLKGTGQKDDGYSAFEATSADLQSYLHQCNVKRLFLAGLTTEYCVKATAEDALRMNFQTHIIRDAVAPVEAHPGDGEKALREMESAGAFIIDSKRLERMQIS
jgi:nicotinamidase/pyrazinamidase